MWRHLEALGKVRAEFDHVGRARACAVRLTSARALSVRSGQRNQPRPVLLDERLNVIVDDNPGADFQLLDRDIVVAWSGNLRLSLILIPVKLHSPCDGGRNLFPHDPRGFWSAHPLCEGSTEEGFEEVPEEEIVKGYEHTKGITF